MTGRGLAVLLAGAALAVFLYGGEASLGGVPAAQTIALLLYGAGALWLTAWAVERARPGWRDAAAAVLMWGVFVTSLTAVYVKRDAAVDGLRSVAQEVGLGRPTTVVTGVGEVAVTRRRDGTFRVAAVVNERPASFLFDTGATAVVLTSETARELGFAPGDLRFRMPVMTANGRTMAAPITLDRLAIGPIVLQRVPALVAGPGLLHENLLGQTVLDRLESYEVRGNRLVLRAGKG